MSATVTVLTEREANLVRIAAAETRKATLEEVADRWNTRVSDKAFGDYLNTQLAGGDE